MPQNKALHVALVGDSTVFEYASDSPMRGWGQVIAEYLPGNISIINEARCGASTKTYPSELWKSLLAIRLDYIVIQFGHNDSHARGNVESADPATEYPQNLRCYIFEARIAGITPILVTPVSRRTYRDGRATNELGPYAEAMKAVAAELQVDLIDLHATSAKLFESLGEAGTEPFTINKLDTADRPGAEDRTHFTSTGAHAIARIVAPELLKILTAEKDLAISKN
ncbi:MAG: rhamnogalacturonan acetylesterase [Chthoniobacteraceae bacterium]